TAGDPNFTPVWGNVLNARVQVQKRFLFDFPLKDLVAQKALTIEPAFLADLDLDQPLPAKEPQELTFTQLKTLYANTKVPAHRFGFKEALKIQSGSLTKALTQATTFAQAPKEVVSKAGLLAGVSLADILGQIEILNGDTTFEQLTCAGYNPQTRTLEGVIQVKLSS